MPPQTDACNTQEVDKLFQAPKNLPSKFGAICRQVLEKMVAKKDLVFSNYSCHADSTWIEDSHGNQL